MNNTALFHVDKILLLRPMIMIANSLAKDYGFKCMILRTGLVKDVINHLINHNGACSIVCTESAKYVCNQSGIPESYLDNISFVSEDMFAREALNCRGFFTINNNLAKFKINKKTKIFNVPYYRKPNFPPDISVTNSDGSGQYFRIVGWPRHDMFKTNTLKRSKKKKIVLLHSGGGRNFFYTTKDIKSKNLKLMASRQLKFFKDIRDRLDDWTLFIKTHPLPKYGSDPNYTNSLVDIFYPYIRIFNGFLFDCIHDANHIFSPGGSNLVDLMFTNKRFSVTGFNFTNEGARSQWAKSHMGLGDVYHSNYEDFLKCIENKDFPDYGDNNRFFPWIYERDGLATQRCCEFIIEHL